MQIKYVIFNILDNDFVSDFTPDGHPLFGDVPLLFSSEGQADTALTVDGFEYYDIKDVALVIQKVLTSR